MGDPRYPMHHDDRVQPRLWRSSEDKVLAGVIGGLAERTNVGSTVLRWLFGAVTVFTGFFPGVLIYLLVWAIAKEHSRWTR
jgi:phage shock protein C